MPSRARGRRGRAWRVALAAVMLAGTTGAAVPDQPDHRVVFSFTDRDITESSGLVDDGEVMHTVNDSGGGPVVYTVAKESGDTVAETMYSSGDAYDVEALAPGHEGAVWVGDIGDNRRTRDTVDVYRVPIDPSATGEVEAPRFSLGYPDSAHDAEALLVHPDTGRLHVATKEITGGTLYAAPRRLDSSSLNEMDDVGRVPGLVTDGAFFPDGDHIMLRSYAGAAVLTFPGLREVARMPLPVQGQGEGLAVGLDGAVYLSSEGAYTEVLQVALPPAVLRALGANAPQETALPAPTETPSQEGDSISTGDNTMEVTAAAGILLLAVVGWLAFTVSRRGRRAS